MARLERLIAVIRGYVVLVMNPRIMVALLILVLTLEAPAEQPDSRQIRKQIEPSIVHITRLSDGGRGGGVLVDKKKGLVVTNAHITKEDPIVDVIFPTHDALGNTIRDESHYNLEKHERSSILRRQGNITKGRVVFENKDFDLAVIRVWALPSKTTTEIKYDSEYDYEKLLENKDVHVFGHPANEREILWQHDAGHYVGTADEGNTVVLDAAVWKGSSGGPVTDNSGVMIGIMKRMSRNDVRSYAVSIRPIAETINIIIKRWFVFGVENETSSKVRYETRWSEEEDWESHILAPGQYQPHVHGFEPKDGYPKIRYQTRQGQKELDEIESKQADDTSEVEMFVEYELTAFEHFFGDDIRDRIVPRIDDILYRFGIDDIEKKGEQLKLYERRKMLWIANHTQHKIWYTLQWAEGAANRDSFYLESGKIKPHFWHPFRPTPPLSHSFPRIKYNTNMDKTVEFAEPTLLSQDDFNFYDMRSYFDMNLKKEDDPSLDIFKNNVQHPVHPFNRSPEKFFLFANTSTNKIGLYKGIHPPPEKWWLTTPFLIRVIIIVTIFAIAIIIVKTVVSPRFRRKIIWTIVSKTC